MKKTIFATALFAIASMPLTFAAQAPATPPAKGSQSKMSQDTTTTKKTRKKNSKKGGTKKSDSTGAPTGSSK